MKLPKLISGKSYLIALIAVFVVVWIWAAIEPLYPRDWLLENLLVFVGVPLIIGTGIYFRLSKLSYTLITVFMVLHVIGSHYTYAEVPFGFTLQRWLGSNRNMYDRLVHFCFGFLLAYPVREVFLRLARVKGFWGYYLPLDLTLAMSASFEILEAIVASRAEPGLGASYLGMQGDIWDAQKDMLLAGLGALVAMLITAVGNMALDRTFWKEMRASFRIPRDDKPLGEVALEEMVDQEPERKSSPSSDP